MDLTVVKPWLLVSSFFLQEMEQSGKERRLLAQATAKYRSYFLPDFPRVFLWGVFHCPGDRHILTTVSHETLNKNNTSHTRDGAENLFLNDALLVPD